VPGVGCKRLFPAPTRNDCASLGRVTLVDSTVRGLQLGLLNIAL